MRAITGDEGDFARACSTMYDTHSSVTRVTVSCSSSMYVSSKLAGSSLGSSLNNIAVYLTRRSAYLTTPPGRLAAHSVQDHLQFRPFWSVILARILTGGLTAASCPATATGPATARGPSTAAAAKTTSASVSASVAGTSFVGAAPAIGVAACAIGAAACTTTGAVPATCACAGAAGAAGAAAAAAAAATSRLRCCFSRLKLGSWFG